MFLYIVLMLAFVSYIAVKVVKAGAGIREEDIKQIAEEGE